MPNPRFTPGPWRWALDANSKRVALCGGVIPYDLTVLDFVRYGMSGAAPRFREPDAHGFNIMHRADHWGAVVPGREHHADWFQTLAHPDALLISTAPDLYYALQDLLDCQNGPPLVRDEIQWARAVQAAEKALAKARGEEPR